MILWHEAEDDPDGPETPVILSDDPVIPAILSVLELVVDPSLSPASRQIHVDWLVALDDDCHQVTAVKLLSSVCAVAVVLPVAC